MTPMPQPEPRSCCLSLSSGTLNDLAYRIRCHRRQHRSRRRRRLEPGRQDLLALAPLRNGGTGTRLAAGFEVGVSTAWRYVREVIAALATAADDLSAALQQLRRLGVRDPGRHPDAIEWVADQKPYHSGKHNRHGVNVQVIADAAGRLCSGLRQRCPDRSMT